MRPLPQPTREWVGEDGAFWWSIILDETRRDRDRPSWEHRRLDNDRPRDLEVDQSRPYPEEPPCPRLMRQ